MSRKEQLSPAEKKRRKGRTRLIWKTILLAVLLVILLGMIWLASGGMEKLEQMGFWGNSPENSQEFQEPRKLRRRKQRADLQRREITIRRQPFRKRKNWRSSMTTTGLWKF